MLSDWEREQLALIERNLYADRQFAKASNPIEQRRAKATVLLLVTAVFGMGVVIAGVATDIAAVGVLGFVLMLVGAVISLRQPPEPVLLPVNEAQEQ